MLKFILYRHRSEVFRILVRDCLACQLPMMIRNHSLGTPSSNLQYNHQNTKASIHQTTESIDIERSIMAAIEFGPGDAAGLLDKILRLVSCDLNAGGSSVWFWK